MTTTRFVGHYLEMCAAMVVGMLLFAPLWPAAWSGRPDAAAAIMAVDMAVAMGLWMRIRRHSRAATTEMCLVMLLPFALLLPAFWLGLLSGTALMIAGHVVMFPLMLLVMLRRRTEYAHGVAR
ncbi:hypothetical protein [Pseudonocardia xishanensis]